MAEYYEQVCADKLDNLDVINKLRGTHQIFNSNEIQTLNKLREQVEIESVSNQKLLKK